MGCASSQPESAESLQSKNIDNLLNDAKNESLLDFKVLLLGAGESGKSTVVKQLKVLHKVQMDDQELLSYAVNIHKNTVQCMQNLLENSDTLGIPIDAGLQQSAENVKSFIFDSDQKKIPVSVANDIEALWKSAEIQQVWSRRSEFWFLDATPYYFENIQRFIEDGYVPTEEDCIMTRVRTTGIAVTEFDEGSVHFRVVDVGGQRNERKKWIHCFDDVKALLFVVNLAGYDQVMFEDPNQNRMNESLDLFGQICNNPVFSSTPIFLCFNKKDLFEQMIQTNDLCKCFPDYTGEKEVQVALQFIESKFKARMSNSNATMKTSYIAARFKKDVKYTWEEVKETLLEENKKQVALAAKGQQKRKK